MSAYLFIDGAYLREAYTDTMTKYFGVAPPINWPAGLAQFGHIQRVYYYDAIDRNRVKDETEEEQKKRIAEANAFHAFLNRLDNLHVREGFTSRGRRASRRTQKAVDVQLAVDALEHAAKSMSVAVFIFGDLDFEPLLFSLGRSGVQTVVWYERGTACNELLEAADIRQQMTLRMFYQMAMPGTVSAIECPTFGENSSKPSFAPFKTGTWNSRTISFIAGPSGNEHWVWADAGSNPLREPSVFAFVAGYDYSKLDTAFTMNYGGEIAWKL